MKLWLLNPRSSVSVSGLRLRLLDQDYLFFWCQNCTFYTFQQIIALWLWMIFKKYQSNIDSFGSVPHTEKIPKGKVVNHHQTTTFTLTCCCCFSSHTSIFTVEDTYTVSRACCLWCISTLLVQVLPWTQTPSLVHATASKKSLPADGGQVAMAATGPSAEEINIVFTWSDSIPFCICVHV